MANTKPVGVAYSDPELTNPELTGTLSGAGAISTTGAITTTGAMTAATMATTGNSIAGNANGAIVFLSTAITANSTTTSLTAGTIAFTNNATGIGKAFYSDGTKFQFLANS
jgi:hypothetical protein